MSETSPERNWKVVLAYDGTDFHGWQVQPRLATIQGALAEAITRVTGKVVVLPQGSGRTDAGVHAEGQVASFALAAPIPAENLHRALNRTLPLSIRILSVEEVPLDFHARHSVKEKTYEYRLFAGGICPPTLARYVHACRWELNFAAMQQAAEHVVGEHDFTSFAASDPDLTTRTAAESGDPQETSNIRTIFSSRWSSEPCHDGQLLRYSVCGNGFLHHMVRNLVGTFIEVGCGRLAPDDLPRILAAKNRSAAGPTAPASGLFLMHVGY
ncbi:MAG: tRNA pseudouridine(38-40) synthase TruA [Acidobacteriaceae bacterium]